MKTIHQKKKLRTRGSALFVTMGVLAVAAILIASYLGLVQYQSASVWRSQSWNMTMTLTEAGVEEGLALLNYNAPAIQSNPMSWTNQLTANGWSALDTNNVTSVTRQVGSNSYTVTITINTNGMPVVDSLGSVTYNGSSWIFSSARSPMFAAAGMGMLAAATTGAGSTSVARKIEVQTDYTRAFTMGIMAKSNITFTGNALLDSFDSSNTNYSTGGKYDSSKAEANCSVGSDSDVVNAITGSGNLDLYGTAHTGPTGGYTLSGNASVGDAGWVNGGNRGIQPGHFYKDMNMNFPDVQAPSMLGGMSPSLTLNNGALTWVLSQSTSPYQMISSSWGNYNMLITGTNVSLEILGPLNLSSPTITVTNGANATIYVTGSLSISGTSAINIATNGSLKMYVGGASTSFSGKGIINAGNAVQCQYYGLPGNTSVSYSGQSAFIGTVYAPEANYAMSGGGDFYGASVSYTVQNSGNANFHYDENLKKVGPSTGFYVTNWKEIAAH